MKLQDLMDGVLSRTSPNENTPLDSSHHVHVVMNSDHHQQKETLITNSCTNEETVERDRKIVDEENFTLKVKVKPNLHLELLKNTQRNLFDVVEKTKMAPNPRAQDIDALSPSVDTDVSAELRKNEDESHSASRAMLPTRTISEIKSSLEHKVRRLRAERSLLERKIQISEEYALIDTHDSVQSDIISRKNRLRRVICDMRRKLEDQAKRLQGNYNTILAIQRNVLRCRSFTMKRRFITDSVVRESPF